MWTEIKVRFYVWQLNRRAWALQRSNAKLEMWLERDGIAENGYTFAHECKACTGYEIIEPERFCAKVVGYGD